MTKKRTLNEHREVKDSVYETKKIDFDSQYLTDLVKKFPNDKDLGSEIRKYFLFLKQNNQ